MAKEVIAPAYGMAQETVTIVQWLKHAGDHVTKGEPIAEIETDKARVELEAPTSGVLANITAAAGDDLPVGRVIAVILSPEDTTPDQFAPALAVPPLGVPPTPSPGNTPPGMAATGTLPPAASPLASRIAAEHGLDLNQIRPARKRVQKADVLDYLQQQTRTLVPAGASTAEADGPALAVATRLVPASPKARRLAAEQGIALTAIQGTGPGGAVLASNLIQPGNGTLQTLPAAHASPRELSVSHIWRVMAERTTQSWTTIPHIFLVREVNASRLQVWRERLLKRSSVQITYTDLLVKLVAATLRQHPRLNATWNGGKIRLNEEVHIGLAVATEDGLVVPVIHQADTLRLAEIAERRKDLVARAQTGKLRPDDLREGTFTISNLGMYGVDAFTALITPPQVAILAVGRILERVVPVAGQPGVQPTLMISLSCDHRVVDGARGGQFLAALAEVIEEPLGLLE
jgi:pyruvate dehydrogenase E2 component (dihydrolipoamide acetyltransferase)